jgi:putative CocE/NonD family hydrolase
LEGVSVYPAYGKLKVPALNIGGWYDLFSHGTIQNYTALAGNGSRLVMGPWAHMLLRNVVGDLDFGFGSDMAFMNLQSDMTGLTTRFFDYHLKGTANGLDAEPPVRFLVMGENYWREEDEFPLARTRYVNWYIHSQGHANTVSGVLSTEPPEDEPADQFAYDPSNPVLTCGGAFLMSSVFRPGTADQRPTEARADVLVYTSAPLEQDMEVTGPVVVHLFAASDAPDTDFVARLVDVHPDGYAQNLTSSNFPRWDRNPNTGAPIGSDTELRIAHQTVLHDRLYPSHIVLPVIPR